MGAGRPHAEHRAEGIGDDRHPPAVEAAEGLGQEAAARLHRARGDCLRVIDPHVRGPRGRHSGLRGRADRGHVAPAQPAHAVPRVRTGRSGLLHVPAEHAGIERRRRVRFSCQVSTQHGTPCRTVALGQDGSFGKRSLALSAAAPGARWAPLPLSAEMQTSCPRRPRLSKRTSSGSRRSALPIAKCCLRLHSRRVSGLPSEGLLVLHGGCRANVLLSAGFKTIAGMAQNFIACDREQPFLLPPDVRDWLPEDHLAWFVIDAVGVMDLAMFYAAYRQDGHGRAAYEPAVMVALLLYCWARGDAVRAGDRAGVRGGRRVPRDRRPAAARSRDDRSLRRASRARAGRAVRRGARAVRRRRFGDRWGDRDRRHQGRGQRQPRPHDGLRAARQDDRAEQIAADAAETSSTARRAATSCRPSWPVERSAGLVA